MNSSSSKSNLFRRIGRFDHVVNVLAKHGFGEALTRMRIWESHVFERRFLRRESKFQGLTAAQRLRLALEELGPTFIKLGQVLSTRPDLLPPEFIAELKKLQASAQFVPADIIRGIIESELGAPIARIFESFEDEPLAAASLAQVHRAVFKGRQVVLKVQRPNIAQVTLEDVDILHSLASLAERHSRTLYLANPVGLVEEFAEQIKRELDFRMEVNNLRHFAENFARDDTLRVPEPYPDLCTRRVITMEYLDGINISQIQRLKSEGYNLETIAKRGAILGFKASFEHGFFHADPHPGNVFVLPGNVIGLVDFGMMAILSLRDRERLAKLVYFISEKDEKRVARALNELMESEDVIPAEELEPSMSAIIKDYGDIPLRELRLAGMLFAMMRIIMGHGGRLRPQLVWITKSIAVQEDIARSLNADFSMMDLGKPYAREFLARKLNPARQPYELYYWLIDTLDTVKDLPYDVGIIMREIRKGRIKIEFEHIGLDPIRRTMENMSKRQTLTNSMIAFLVSASLVVLAGVPPFIGHIPLLSFIGYIIAAVLALLVLASLLRNRR
jgi:ubiquinone biosynthesis protein